MRGEYFPTANILFVYIYVHYIFSSSASFFALLLMIKKCYSAVSSTLSN